MFSDTWATSKCFYVICGNFYTAFLSFQKSFGHFHCIEKSNKTLLCVPQKNEYEFGMTWGRVNYLLEVKWRKKCGGKKPKTTDSQWRPGARSGSHRPNILLRFLGWTTCFLETVCNGVWDTFSLVWWVCQKCQPNQQQHVYKPHGIKETARTMGPCD